MFKVPIALAGVLVSLCGNSWAAESHYECTVRQVWQVERGTTAFVQSPLASLYVGRSFKIHRTTGKIDSDLLPFRQLKVVSRGTKYRPFLAETYAINGQFLRVEEFRDTAKKPFILVDVIDVKLGDCV